MSLNQGLPLHPLVVHKKFLMPNGLNQLLKEVFHSPRMGHKKLDCEVIPPVSQ